MSTSGHNAVVVVQAAPAQVLRIEANRTLVVDGSAPAQVVQVAVPPATTVVLARVEQVRVLSAAQQGPAGAGYVPYEHVQVSAAALWTVAHNLGHKPGVTVLSVGGVEMLAEVVHLGSNSLQIVFDSAAAGSALCV